VDPPGPGRISWSSSSPPPHATSRHRARHRDEQERGRHGLRKSQYRWPPAQRLELLTATFAGDKAYCDRTGEDFRLNDDWSGTQAALLFYPVLAGLENTDLLQTVSLLASYEGPTATTARKEDILKLELQNYLAWAPKVREALVWVAGFLDSLNIHVAADLPYPKLIVPLSPIKVVLGEDADIHGVNKRLRQWFGAASWASSTEVQSRRGSPETWSMSRPGPGATGDPGAPRPRTVDDATFVESRLHSLRTRNAAAYKGIYALLMAQHTKDSLRNQPFDKAHFLDMQVDIHHIFPKAWCVRNNITPELRESVLIRCRWRRRPISGWVGTPHRSIPEVSNGPPVSPGRA
jgi:hypothetical protein